MIKRFFDILKFDKVFVCVFRICLYLREEGFFNFICLVNEIIFWLVIFSIVNCELLIFYLKLYLLVYIRVLVEFINF